MSTACPLTPDTERLRSAIRDAYAGVALDPDRGFHFHTGRPLARRLGYRDQWLEGIPEPAVESFAGTGNPLSLAALERGEHIVDVGSGAGLDSLIAGRMVGPRGRVIGVDMTPAMIEKAACSAAACSIGNVEFRYGYAESLPVDSGWANAIVSNGVLNLVPDKTAALGEMWRVLRPGGRLQLADIIVQRAVPERARQRIDLWAG